MSSIEALLRGPDPEKIQKELCLMLDEHASKDPRRQPGCTNEAIADWQAARARIIAAIDANAQHLGLRGPAERLRADLVWHAIPTRSWQ